ALSCGHAGSHDAADGVPPRRAHRRRRCRPARKLYGQDRGHRARLSRRRPLPAQIHGGMGLATEMPISQMWRDARSFMITEGPVEVMRMVLAREIFRGQV